MMAGEILGQSLVADILSIDPSTAEAFVAARYGIIGSATRLTAERDCNFVIQTEAGDRYVLKVTNPKEDRVFVNFQTSALRHLELKTPAIPVPRVLPTVDGNFEPELRLTPSGSAIARLLTYVPGEVLRFSNRTAQQRHNLGRVAAELAVSLQDYDHPGARHLIAWDIKNAGRLRELMSPSLGEQADQEIIVKTLDVFDQRLAPRLPNLRAQIVHNDLNRNNVIVDAEDHSRIVAILDFGDMVHTALINDVAIGAANQLGDTPDLLAPAADFVGGYHMITPLSPEELGMLPDLIAVRLAVSVIITEWRARRFPDNRTHILRNTESNRQRLHILLGMPRTTATSIFLHACERPRVP